MPGFQQGLLTLYDFIVVRSYDEANVKAMFHVKTSLETTPSRVKVTIKGILQQKQCCQKYGFLSLMRMFNK